MSNTAKYITGIIVGILVVAIIIWGFSALTKKDNSATWIDKIFTGDLEAEVEPVDTGFKVFTTNTGLVVTNPSNGIVSEEGTVDYTKALYIDMTADNGYYSNNDDIVGFTIYKNGAGSFLYLSFLDKHMGTFYNQYFKNGNTAYGYLNRVDPMLEYCSIETGNYLSDITYMNAGVTYTLTPKQSVYNINTFIYNLCTYAVTTAANGYGNYVVIVDVTDYFDVTTNNGSLNDRPILFSFSVEYVNDLMDTSGNFEKFFVEKIFEVVTDFE